MTQIRTACMKSVTPAKKAPRSHEHRAAAPLERRRKARKATAAADADLEQAPREAQSPAAVTSADGLAGRVIAFKAHEEPAFTPSATVGSVGAEQAVVPASVHPPDAAPEPQPEATKTAPGPSSPNFSQTFRRLS